MIYVNADGSKAVVPDDGLSRADRRRLARGARGRQRGRGKVQPQTTPQAAAMARRRSGRH